LNCYNNPDVANDDRNVLRWKVNFCLAYHALGTAFARKIQLPAAPLQVHSQRVSSLAVFRENGANCGGLTGARRAAHWLLIHWVCGSECRAPLSLPEWVVGSDGPETHAYTDISAQALATIKRYKKSVIATIYAAYTMSDLRY